MKYKFPKKIKSDLTGFNELLKFYTATKDLTQTDIYIDFSETQRMDANLCALLGAMFDNLNEDLNSIYIGIRDLNDKVNDILSRNGFLSFFGQEKAYDRCKTTVEYKKFKTSEGQSFFGYLKDDLFTKNAFPKMSEKLKKDILEKIYEIFENAKTHGEYNYIFCCGQHFVQQHRFDFTIVNLGKTFKENVSKFNNIEFSADKAILWAIEGNSTKKGISGGLGLSQIRKFLKFNEGKLQIISDNAYFEENKDNFCCNEIDVNFQGTIVNLEFNVDNNYYQFADENVDLDDLFG